MFPCLRLAFSFCKTHLSSQPRPSILWHFIFRMALSSFSSGSSLPRCTRELFQNCRRDLILWLFRYASAENTAYALQELMSGLVCVWGEDKCSPSVFTFPNLGIFLEKMTGGIWLLDPALAESSFPSACVHAWLFFPCNGISSLSNIDTLDMLHLTFIADTLWTAGSLFLEKLSSIWNCSGETLTH